MKDELNETKEEYGAQASEPERLCTVHVDFCTDLRIVCPVSPVAIGSRILRYDRVDLDRWIDSLKGECGDAENDNWNERLLKCL